MKYIYILLPLVLIGIYAFKSSKVKLTTNKTNLYDFVVTDLQGNEFDFSTLKGKKVMIVNTASKCGLTPQYKQLQEIYTQYKDLHNFVIVGFPSNDFLFQEPGDNQQIEEFCQLNYGVTFPMMSKVDVKGKKQAEIYQFLTHKKLNGFKDSKVKWNFQKYLIGRNGKLEQIINPKTKPNDSSIISWITD